MTPEEAIAASNFVRGRTIVRGTMVPYDPRSGRLWNFFTKVADWYPIREWPTHVQRAALAWEKNNEQRFLLYLFFRGNGLPHEIAKAWTLIGDYQNGRIVIPPRDDGKVWRHMLQLKRQVEQEGIVQKYQWFDLERGIVANK